MTTGIRTRQLAQVLLLAICASVCLSARAQSTADPHWLLEYKGPYHGHDLKWDTRFKPFIDHYLQMKQNIMPHTPKMADVVSNYIGVPGEYRSKDDRYFYADGCMAHACEAKGMLWVDMQPSPPTVVFAALDDPPGSKGPGLTVYIFASRDLEQSDLPGDLKSNIDYWTSKPLADRMYELEGAINRAVIIGPDSREHTIDPAAVGVPPAAQERSKNQ